MNGLEHIKTAKTLLIGGMTLMFGVGGSLTEGNRPDSGVNHPVSARMTLPLGVNRLNAGGNPPLSGGIRPGIRVLRHGIGVIPPVIKNNPFLEKG